MSARAGTVLRLAATGACLLLAACASAPRHHAARAPQRTFTHADHAAASPKEANDVLFRAISLVGTPYHWGGNTPDSGFDCSGLVDYVYRTMTGIKLPRTSHAMSRMDTQKVHRLNRLASGDLLFFRTEGHRISHVGIYVGRGRFVHAPNSGGTVRLDTLTNRYWGKHFAFARRIIE
ncbi:C40 family peptidase [Oleiagrimonas sp. C23AA]|uniref:C40 family peptidase n=1 Tax=Oleiagrimonas sp. C23AA TaxID=2719047 RepID=UPI001F0E0A99|nr:C40 family peptidase [Oleiagrimonas sp. C23AA]